MLFYFPLHTFPWFPFQAQFRLQHFKPLFLPFSKCSYVFGASLGALGCAITTVFHVGKTISITCTVPNNQALD